MEVVYDLSQRTDLRKRWSLPTARAPMKGASSLSERTACVPSIDKAARTQKQWNT